jgi:hypothetical protein
MYGTNPACDAVVLSSVKSMTFLDLREHLSRVKCTIRLAAGRCNSMKIRSKKLAAKGQKFD